MTTLPRADGLDVFLSLDPTMLRELKQNLLTPSEVDVVNSDTYGCRALNRTRGNNGRLDYPRLWTHPRSSLRPLEALLENP